eukprot:TRINITY_DN2442_c0_g3_i5.p1 TRINITY_DN2442_c0_g3~~TRINITY_DN2442_c0_g3_i5.p1  ORF type:complete len:254 (+),score=24.23 TRINITY_DN2442_c0_g3_i5:255-1016(+)
MATSFFSSSASFVRVAVPSVLYPAHLNRRVPSPTRFSSTLLFQLPRELVATGNRPLNFRSMAVGENSEATGVPKSVPVRVAHELLQAGHRYLDVRTVEEFKDGHAAGAINIPYMFKAGMGMTKNPNFLEEASAHFGKDDEIIVGCQSGKRSLMAATELSSAGFTGITDIAGGYSAWTQNGLPTESKSVIKESTELLRLVKVGRFYAFIKGINTNVITLVSSIIPVWIDLLVSIKICIFTPFIINISSGKEPFP